MVIRHGFSWLSSLWLIDLQVAEWEVVRERTAWSTACGPLTILCRSDLAHDALHNVLPADGNIELRSAANRTDLCMELARFAEGVREPYVHIVVGSFDYAAQVVNLLGKELVRALPPLCAVECAVHISDAYSFRARSFFTRLGLDGGDGTSPANPPIEMLLIRADVFRLAVCDMMRVPPDPSWVRMFTARLLERCRAPLDIPLLMGAIMQAAPITDAADWQSHCLPVVEDMLAQFEAAAVKPMGANVAARHLIRLVNLLRCLDALPHATRQFLVRRATTLARSCLDALAGTELVEGDTAMVLHGALCEVLGLDGPETLELRLHDCAQFFRQRLVDYVEGGTNEAAAAVVNAVLAGGHGRGEAYRSDERSRALMQRLRVMELEKRFYRASTAAALDRLQAERQRARLLRAAGEDTIEESSEQ